MVEVKVLRSFKSIVIFLATIAFCYILIKFKFIVEHHTEKQSQPKLLPEQTRNELNEAKNDRLVHVSYVHFLDTRDAPTVENFKFFMNFAYAPCNPNIFFTLIFNCKDMTGNATQTLVDLLGSYLVYKLQKCSIDEDQTINFRPTSFKNTKIVLRKNKPGGDLCANVDNMKKQFWINNEKLFKYFFFINSSVRGPFLPTYYLKPWWEMFLDLFDKYTNAVAFGPYLSCEFGPHIQSFMIGLDRRGLAIMKQVYRCPVGEEAKSGRMNWIIDTEVRLGKSILEAGYEMRSLLSIYAGMDGSKEGIKKSNCVQWNPTKDYPISVDDKSQLYSGDRAAGRYVKYLRIDF
jgi:hypothetical protein